MPVIFIEAAMVQPRKKHAWMNKWVPNEILNDEWVQIRNPGQQDVKLDGLEIRHLVYIGFGDNVEKKEALVAKLNGVLPKGVALRLHSGKGKAWLDEKTKIIHAYANPQDSEFLYQVAKPDCLILASAQGHVDYAWYHPPLIEGKRVKRTDRLEEFKMVQIVKQD